jgi:hypothetical protein
MKKINLKYIEVFMFGNLFRVGVKRMIIREEDLLEE